MTEKATILLAMPWHNDIYKVMESALAYHGFQVIPIIFNDGAFRYPSFFTRFQTKFRQIILQDKNAKRKLKEKLFDEKIKAVVEAIEGGIDYALFIRADLYPAHLLEAVQKKTRMNMVNYQWDGMNRYPEIWSKTKYFDRFFIFSPDDLQYTDYSFLPTTNFYFDHDLNNMPPIEADFYFTGSHMPDRMRSVILFGELAQDMGWKLNFNIGWFEQDIKKSKNIYPRNINIFSHEKSFSENLNQAKRAKVLVDFKTPIHDGLSFRAFEALGYHKKLITTNKNIKKYDFYHPDNILVWDGKNLNGINEFLAIPYHPIDPEIYKKYSFGNWIRYILQFQSYQSIYLPIKN